MKQTFVLVFAALLQSACVPAIVTKSPGGYGRVTNARTHAPVPQAEVRFLELRTATTTTDSDGRFDLPYLRELDLKVLLPGQEWHEVTLQVAHPGYRMFTEKILTKEAHQNHDVALEPLR